jgi:hypothetical protein
MQNLNINFFKIMKEIQLQNKSKKIKSIIMKTIIRKKNLNNNQLKLQATSSTKPSPNLTTKCIKV